VPGTTFAAAAGFLVAGWLLVAAACGGDAGNRPAASGRSRVEGPRDTTAGPDTAVSTGPAAMTDDWLILPGERVGPVTLTTSEAELLSRLGDDAIARREIYLAEGFCTAGTVLYPGTPDSLDIAWADSARTRPAFVRITGAGSRWVTPAGVRIGSTLEELEAIHGGPLTFSGFGWDYGGGLGWPEWNGILGDRTVRSDNPLIRKLTIVVESIAIGPGAARDEHECREIR